MTPLGQKVKELRHARGMTQVQLARKAGLGHALASRLESGISKYVTTRDIRSLAAALDVPEDELWKTIPGGRSEKRYIPITDRVEGGTTEIA